MRFRGVWDEILEWIAGTQSVAHVGISRDTEASEEQRNEQSINTMEKMNLGQMYSYRATLARLDLKEDILE